MKLRDIGHFYQLLRYAHPVACFTIVRPDAPAAPSQDAAIPESRKAHYVPQNDFAYKVGSNRLFPVSCSSLPFQLVNISIARANPSG
jgi:hypothetical protein